MLATGYGEMPPQFDLQVQRLSKPFTQANLQRAVILAAEGSPGE